MPQERTQRVPIFYLFDNSYLKSIQPALDKYSEKHPQPIPPTIPQSGNMDVGYQSALAEHRKAFSDWRHLQHQHFQREYLEQLAFEIEEIGKNPKPNASAPSREYFSWLTFQQLLSTDIAVLFAAGLITPDQIELGTSLWDPAVVYTFTEPDQNQPKPSGSPRPKTAAEALAGSY